MCLQPAANARLMDADSRRRACRLQGFQASQMPAAHQTARPSTVIATRHSPAAKAITRGSPSVAPTPPCAVTSGHLPMPTLSVATGAIAGNRRLSWRTPIARDSVDLGRFPSGKVKPPRE